MTSAVVNLDPLPSVPVFGRHVLSWPTQKPEKPWGPNDATISLPIDQALVTAFDSDAHFVAYEADRRLNTDALGACTVKMVIAVFDVDAPNHWPTLEWRTAEREKFERLCAIAPGCVAFDTRGGYRLIWRLHEPQTLDNDYEGSIWAAIYRGWLEWLKREAGIVGDAACADWTRLFRLPFVHRDGEDQRLPAGGDLRAGVWDFARGKEFVVAPAANTNALRVSVVDEGESESQPDESIASIVAAATPLFTKGRRHALAFAIPGWLRKRGWNESDALRVIEALPSNDPLARLKDARDGFRANQGWQALCRLIGDNAAAALDAATPNPKRAAKLADEAAAQSLIPAFQASAVVLGAAPPVPAASISTEPRTARAKRRKKPTGWVGRTLDLLCPPTTTDGATK
jgi:hypothetical protein